MNILKLENVVKIYGRGGNATKALDGVSLDVAEGEFVTIMGASGSGKTTLLNLIASIDSVTGGTICVDGRDITRMSEKELADYRGQKIGFVFQDYNLIDTLTVYENVVLPLTLKNVKPEEIVARADDIMKKFGIGELSGKFPDEISGGERQRAACARALISSPSLILADEPTGALDSRNSRNLMQLLRMMNVSFGATILTVTHDPVVASYASRVLFLRDGRLFNEVPKGEKTDAEFFREITDVSASAGGRDDAV